MLAIINQVFEIAQKLGEKNETVADRNLKRIFYELEEMGYQVNNPLNRRYHETDTDVDATLSGPLRGELLVTRVLKPVVYQKNAGGELELLQKGIVIVEGK